MAAIVQKIVLRTPETVGALGQYSTLDQCRQESSNAALQAQNAQGFMGQASASAQSAALSATQAAASAASFPKGVAPEQLPPAWCLGSAAFQNLRFIDAATYVEPEPIQNGQQGIVSSGLNVPGARPGDYALASCSVPLQGLDLRAEVVSNDRVNVYLTNMTGVGVGGPFGTYYVRIMKRIP